MTPSRKGTESRLGSSEEFGSRVEWFLALAVPPVFRAAADLRKAVETFVRDVAVA